MEKITARNWEEGNIRLHSVKSGIDQKPLLPMPWPITLQNRAPEENYPLQSS
jgi:hypothetical protein